MVKNALTLCQYNLEASCLGQYEQQRIKHFLTALAQIWKVKQILNEVQEESLLQEAISMVI